MWFSCGIATPQIRFLSDMMLLDRETLYHYRKLMSDARTQESWGATVRAKHKHGPGKPRHMYRYRQPFAPVLCHSAERWGIVVAPHRQWLEPNGCTTCGITPLKPCCVGDGSEPIKTDWMHPDGCKECGYKTRLESSERHHIVEEIDIKSTLEPIRKKHPSNFKGALKLVLAAKGHPIGSTHTMAAYRSIMKELDGKAVSLEKLSDYLKGDRSHV